MFWHFVYCNIQVQQVDSLYNIMLCSTVSFCKADDIDLSSTAEFIADKISSIVCRTEISRFFRPIRRFYHLSVMGLRMVELFIDIYLLFCTVLCVK